MARDDLVSVSSLSPQLPKGPMLYILKKKMPHKIDRNVGVQSRAPTPLEVVPEDCSYGSQISTCLQPHLLTAEAREGRLLNANVHL